jgi:hypothetical protein
MKKIIHSLNFIAAIVGYTVVLYSFGASIYGNIYRYQKINPYNTARIGAEHALAEHYSLRSFTGDGVSMVAWKAYPSAEALIRIVDRDNIERGRIWFSGPFDEQAQKGFEWLTQTPEYAKIQPHVDLILQKQYFYSYDTYNQQGGHIYNCAMWLVSPEHRLIAYLDMDT